ncbi:MAG TPA: SDR family oxidoreductase [Kofleriaceae bacterium]|jgi:NAD(P)-dependent dehydrogenase (short-subunit alcohol dehydrogenase family)
MRLAGKVCVVTGALGLIGRDFVRAFAAEGGRLVLTDLDHGACVDRAHSLDGAMGQGADLTNPAQVASLAAAVLDRYGQIDVLVNSAAIDDKFEHGANDSRFENYSLANWQRSIGTNLTGTFLACQHLGAPMATRGCGSIINIASTYGIVAPDQKLYRNPAGEQLFFKSPAYPTTKAGIIGFTRYLAAYWGSSGVRVNALSPGGVQNGQADYFVAAYSAKTPLGRMATPRDYAGAAVFLASDDSAYMTGANLVVDGGFTAC